MTEVINNILNNVYSFAPIIVLFLLINLSEKNRTALTPTGGKEIGLVCYLLVGFGYFVSFISGLILQLCGVALLRMFGSLYTGGNVLIEKASAPLLWKIHTIGLGLWLPSLVGILLLIPAVRRLVARVLPVAADNRIHALALSLSMLVFMQMLITLGIGLDTLSKTNQPDSSAGTLALLWSQDILLAIMGLIGVGYLSRRSFKEALRRLGLEKITAKELFIGMGTGLVMMAVSTILENVAYTQGWMGDPNVEELTNKLLGPLFTSVPGILTLGLAAALGEEIIFRGALLPRFGLFYTSILFALVHANYGISVATLVVFLLAIVLGIVRFRYNTTVCMIIHATYNISLGILSLT